MFPTEFTTTVQSFSSFLLNKGRKPSTIKRYVYDIEDFGNWLLQSNKLSTSNIGPSLTSNDFEEYFSVLKEQRHYSDNTIHRIYILLKRLYQYLNLSSPLENIEFIQPNRALRDEDFISIEVEAKLKQILTSLEGLTELQSSVRPFLINRNLSIIVLLLNHGLTLQELVSLQMKHIHFLNNTITVPGLVGIERNITLTEEEKNFLFDYYKTIPEPVRPNYNSNDPLFVAFDYNRKTFHWSYESDIPKALTEISIQKMIRLEVARANLRKGISAQHFRNTFILRLIQENKSEEVIMKRTGFKTKISLKRYYNFIKNIGL